VVFGKVDPSAVQAGGAQVVKFNDLSGDEQNQLLASLPVMDNRDPAALTAKLVAMQEHIMKAKLAKLGQQGFKVDAENGQIFLDSASLGDALPAGAKGIQVLKMGEDKSGNMVTYGRLLVDNGTGGLSPSGPEAFLSATASDFSQAVLTAALAGKTAKIPEGSFLVIVVQGDNTLATVLGPDQKPLPGLKNLSVPAGTVVSAIGLLKSQDTGPGGWKGFLSQAEKKMKDMATSLSSMLNGVFLPSR
jgi:hypothetical protein